MTDFTPFRDKLHDHRIPVREELWTRIEAELPPRPSRRIAPWFWMTLLAGAVLGGGLVFLAISWPGTRTPPPPVKPLAQATTSSEKSVDAAGATDVATSPIPASQDVTGISGASMDATNSSLSANPANGSNTANARRTSGRTAPPSGDETPANGSKTVDVANNSTPVSSSIPGLEADGKAAATTADLILSPLPTLTSEIATSMPLVPKQRKPKFKTDIHCYKFSKGTGNLVWSADLYGGYGFSPRTLTDTGTEASFYADARKATENPAYAWNVGGRVNLHLRNGLTFRTGVDYSQVGDVFDYTDTLATQSTTRIDSFFAADGTFLYADTNRVLIFGTLIKKIHNTYRYLDIPLLAGLEIPMKRSMLMIHAGPVINVMSRQEGEILDPALHPRPIDSQDPNRLHAYKSNLGLSLYLGGGVLFPITEHFSALVEPRLIYRLSPVTIDGYPLEERRHLAGLNLGLRYHFL